MADLPDEFSSRTGYPYELSDQEKQAEQPFLDTGIDSAEMLKIMLDNEHIPQSLRKEMWAFFGNTMKLTFLTDEEVQLLLLKFKWYEYTLLESMPKSQYNSQMEKALALVEIEFMGNLYRSRGARLNLIETIAANIHAVFEQRPAPGNTTENASFMKRVANTLKI